MRTSTTQPSVTKKFPIEVPTHTYEGSPTCVYKIWFGKSYFYWKGKSLLQSAEQLAESIERYIRLGKDEPESQIYHLCNYIKRTRCQRGFLEMIDCDFIKPNSVVAIDLYRFLKLEQELIDGAAQDPLCLNNNVQSYIPKWMYDMNKSEVEKFLRFWDKTHK